MMNPRLLIAPLLLAITGCATTSAPPAVPDISRQEIPDVHCLRSTGTHIQQPYRGQCVPGRTITREELDSAGAGDLADTLRRLVPSLQVRR